MKTITTIKEIRAALNQEKKSGKRIGFVPTMGYFHEGHLSLMHKAKEDCDVVVTSIFVNPTQFGPSEDFEAYPRDLKNDSKMAEEAGVDYLFLPSVEEMYPGERLTYVNVEKITKVLCGAKRPGHFQGVATVVSKLFNIIKPDFAYFGEKDYQQLVVLKKMVKGLNFDVQIVGVPTVRDKDGLAMSSRNKYLGPKEREAALILNKSLILAQEMVKNGERSSAKIKKSMTKLFEKEPLVNLEYLSICDIISLQEISGIKGKVLIALAARVRKARLIDNIVVEGN
ncbi:pantoate--beta-alanine ligase [Candidatus Oleimmundimicrobium sp.]|uniref:pantoate--beta-alanine ligase n=1 Tax=Candidatus Oleimmundimicrobium sp. TaxID=3060597 RepID=UPI002716A649|nr:pantoate--beta-alanine ligase [Candidatus Oleimmundimicrobium sp.]MDO8885661.1 pantoate--beta-alanine ligase [Candidatus Oleimmundimicrobium sp.]